MFSKRLLLALIVIAATAQVRLPVRVASVPPAPPGGGTLLTENDLTYLGAFKLPCGSPCNDGNSFDYAGYEAPSGMTYDPATDHLLLVGHQSYNRVGEISIPTPKTTTPASSLNTATLVKPLVDVLDGHLQDQAHGTYPFQHSNIGGLLLYGGRLIVSAYIYYDGGPASTTTSHFVANADISAASGSRYVSGPHTVGNTEAAWVGGPMGLIPSGWQAALGGPGMTSLSSVPTRGRTSNGPTMTVWDPDDTGISDPASATRLLGYFSSPNSFGGLISNACDKDANAAYTCVDREAGPLFPDGYDSVLYAGSHGDITNYCYGDGVSGGAPGNPSPANDSFFGSGSDASTSSDGLTITLPNFNTNQLSIGQTVVTLTSQTLPAMTSTQSAGIWQGSAVITGKGNSGAANAFVTVGAAFTGSLSSQAYAVGGHTCYDPHGVGSKGEHAYPIIYWVRFYDANDLADVKAGLIAYDAPRPYHTWTPSFSIEPANQHTIVASAIDTASNPQRVFFLQLFGNGSAPLVQVYSIPVPAPGPSPQATYREARARYRADRIAALHTERVASVARWTLASLLIGALLFVPVDKRRRIC